MRHSASLPEPIASRSVATALGESGPTTHPSRDAGSSASDLDLAIAWYQLTTEADWVRDVVVTTGSHRTAAA